VSSFPLSLKATPVRAVRLVILGSLVALALAGCGRKGPLEPPPGAVNVKPNPLEEREDVDPNAPKQVIPSIAPVGSKKGKRIEAPKEPFFLDPIL
jgi:predicted small lipoprotein YifL